MSYKLLDFLMIKNVSYKTSKLKLMVIILIPKAEVSFKRISVNTRMTEEDKEKQKTLFNDDI